MPGLRRWRLAWCLALAPSFFFLSAPLGQTQLLSSETSSTSGPDWQQLRNSLDEIEAGLQMTDKPLSEIESSLAEREQELNEKEQLLQQREQALSEREAALKLQENLYADMQKDLESAQKKLKWGWVWLALAAVTGGTIGYFIGK
jgi:chromosome segregation ATPase